MQVDVNKIYDLKTNEDLQFFIEFALSYEVDYVYILEAIQRYLKGNQHTWTPRYYLD